MTVFNPQLDTLAFHQRLCYRNNYWYVENGKRSSCCSKIFTKNRYNHKKVLDTFLKYVDCKKSPNAAANLEVLIKQTAEHNIVVLQYHPLKRLLYGQRVIDISPYSQELKLAKSKNILSKLKELKRRYDKLKKIEHSLNQINSFSKKDLELFVLQAKDIKKALADLKEIKKQQSTKEDQKQIDAAYQKFNLLLENLNKAIQKVDDYIIEECQKQFNAQRMSRKNLHCLSKNYKTWATVTGNFNSKLSHIHLSGLSGLSAPKTIDKLRRECANLKKAANDKIEKNVEEIFTQFNESLRNPELTDAFYEKVVEQFKVTASKVSALGKHSSSVSCKFDQLKKGYKAFQPRILLAKQHYTKYASGANCLEKCITNIYNLNRIIKLIDAENYTSNSNSERMFKDVLNTLTSEVKAKIAEEQKLLEKFSQEIIDRITQDIEEFQEKIKEIPKKSDGDKLAQLANLRRKIKNISLNPYLPVPLQKSLCQTITAHFFAKHEELLNHLDKAMLEQAKAELIAASAIPDLVSQHRVLLDVKATLEVVKLKDDFYREVSKKRKELYNQLLDQHKVLQDALIEDIKNCLILVPSIEDFEKEFYTLYNKFFNDNQKLHAFLKQPHHIEEAIRLLKFITSSFAEIKRNITASNKKLTAAQKNVTSLTEAKALQDLKAHLIKIKLNSTPTDITFQGKILIPVSAPIMKDVSRDLESVCQGVDNLCAQIDEKLKSLEDT